MAENFPKLISDTKPQIQGAKRTLSRINTKDTTPRHTIFKLQKIKDKIPERNLKKKCLTCISTKIKIALDFPSETIQAKENKYLKY